MSPVDKGDCWYTGEKAGRPDGKQRSRLTFSPVTIGLMRCSAAGQVGQVRVIFVTSFTWTSSLAC